MVSKRDRIVLLRRNVDLLSAAVKAGRWVEAQGLARIVEWHATNVQDLEEPRQPAELLPYEDAPG